MNRYQLLYRPASFCTLPRGLNWNYVEAPHDLAHIRTDIPRSAHVFGTVETDRPLTADECRDFEIREAP